MEEKSKSKTLKEKFIDSGTTLKESLKSLTSIKDKTSEKNNESFSSNNKQSPITSIVKSPPLKTISQIPIQQISEKISETASSNFNVKKISFFMFILIILGICILGIYFIIKNNKTNGYQNMDGRRIYRFFTRK